MFRGVFLLLVSHVCYGAHPEFVLPFLGNDVPWPTKQSIEKYPAWLECNENIEPQIWCSDEFEYYSVKVWGEVTGSHGDSVTGLTLNAQYTRHDWSQFQLNLRKDGFEIAFVQIGEKQFSVHTELESSPQEADKSLILFLNRFGSTFPQIIYWQHEKVRAKLETDGNAINLQFTE